MDEDKENQGRKDEAQDPNRPAPGEEGRGLGAPDKEDLPDTEASPDTDVSTTDAALEEGAPTSSGAIEEDPEEAERAPSE